MKKFLYPLVLLCTYCGVKIAPSPQLTDKNSRYKDEAARRAQAEAARQGKKPVPTPTPTPTPTATPQNELPPQQ